MSDSNKKKKFALFTIIKNLWDREGEKARQKKGNKIKKPRGYRARSFGRLTFWVLFTFMFLVVVATLMQPSAAESEKEPIIQKDNKATSQEAVQYAQNFTKEYFTWQKGDNDDWISKRASRLSNYLAKGLDENAGLSTNIDWSSQLNSSELAKVEDKGDNKAYVTLKVSADFVKKWKEEEVTKKDDKEEKKQVDKEEKKPFVKYFVVPVAYQNGTYGVYELPKYTNIQDKTKVSVQQNNNLDEYKGNQQAVIGFMNTFFTSYSQDTKDKLNYMLADNSKVEGLEGQMDFVKLKDSQIKQDSKGTIKAFTTVVLEDPETKVQFNSDYSLLITKEQDRYLVKELNAQ